MLEKKYNMKQIRLFINYDSINGVFDTTDIYISLEKNKKMRCSKIFLIQKHIYISLR